MAKISDWDAASTIALLKRKKEICAQLAAPANFLRASYVKQLVACGKSNCRCRRGFRHGPFHYVVQCVKAGTVRKFLLKSAGQRTEARAAIAAHADFCEKLEELSQINTELLRRGESLTP